MPFLPWVVRVATIMPMGESIETTEYRLGEYESTIAISRGLPDSVHGDLVVTDRNLARRYPHLVPGAAVILPAGERHKRIERIVGVLSCAVGRSLARDSVIAGLGGGVICDMTAFAASLYMRGCRLLLVPTTLLAMVDAAIGGKTGVDFCGYKNLVGTYYPASKVEVNTGFLASLDRREYLCGLAEVIKAGMLGDEELWKLLKDHGDEVLSRSDDIVHEMVTRAIRVKTAVVTTDLRESGIRAHLNLGHTFAHGLESVMGFKSISHGEAVAWGINMAMVAGRDLGITDQAWADEVRALLQAYGYRLSIPRLDVDALLVAMKHDKKKKGSAVRFVLQKGILDTIQQPLDDAFLAPLLARENAAGR